MAREDKVRRIDWFQVIVGLSREGYSPQSVAAHINIPRGTLLGWKQGAEPRFTEGERLLTFWCQVTGKTRDNAPTVTIDDCWSYHSKA